MLRITITNADTRHPTIRLEGQLADAWIAELRSICTQVLTDSDALTIDLAAVTLIDRPGFTFLDSLTRRGVALTGCSPFQAEQLRQTRAAHSTTTNTTP